MDVQRRSDLPATTPTFDITFAADASVPADPLQPYIRVRSTQRRALSNRPLTRHERAALQAAVQHNYRVVWLPQPRPADAEDYLAAGRALQRVWLTATRLGLQLQPEMTPLIFAEYVRNDLRFTTHEPGWLSAKRESAQLPRLLGPETCARAMFMGRIGAGPAPQARSVRLPLEELLIKP